MRLIVAMTGATGAPLAAPLREEMTDQVPVHRIYRSWTGPALTHADAVPLAIGMYVLGGLESSRLDNALVRGDQTAVRVSTFVLPFQRVSVFEVQVDVKPGQDADAVSRRLDEIIADFIANGPTEDEVRRIRDRREQLIQRFDRELEQLEAGRRRAHEGHVHGLRFDVLDVAAATLREVLVKRHRVGDRAHRNGHVIDGIRTGVHGVPWLSSFVPAKGPGGAAKPASYGGRDGGSKGARHRRGRSRIRAAQGTRIR